MDKYRKHVKERFPKQAPSYIAETQDPLVAAQAHLLKGRFADQIKEQFFDEAYGDILADLFVAWLKTESHCTKEREFLYSCAMALGSVKGKMINYSNMGANSIVIAQQKKDAQEGATSQEGTSDNAE